MRTRMVGFSVSGTKWIWTCSRRGTLGTLILWLNREMRRYPSTNLVSRRQKTSCGQGEGTDEAVARSAGFVEWKAGDLLGCGMDLLVVVAMQLLFQDSANLFPGADSLQGTSADDAVLEPAVGPFDLALGLGRESRAGSWRDWACVAKARAPKWAIRRHNVSHPRGPTQ